MTTYTITDKVTGATQTGIAKDSLEAALWGTLPDIDEGMTAEAREAWSEARQVCTNLVAKLWAGEYYGGEEAYLQVSVDAEQERRPGRPRVGEQINLRLPAEMIAAIDATARAEGTTRAEWIRRALAARLAAARS